MRSGAHAREQQAERRPDRERKYEAAEEQFGEVERVAAETGRRR